MTRRRKTSFQVGSKIRLHFGGREVTGSVMEARGPLAQGESRFLAGLALQVFREELNHPAMGLWPERLSSRVGEQPLIVNGTRATRQLKMC